MMTSTVGAEGVLVFKACPAKNDAVFKDVERSGAAAELEVVEACGVQPYKIS